MAAIDHKAILGQLRALVNAEEMLGNFRWRPLIPTARIREVTGEALVVKITLDGWPRTCLTCEFGETGRIFSQLPTCPVCMEEQRMELRADLQAFDHSDSKAILGQPLYVYYEGQYAWYGAIVSDCSAQRGIRISFLDDYHQHIWMSIEKTHYMWRASGSITSHVPDGHPDEFAARGFETVVEQTRKQFWKRLSSALTEHIPIQPLCFIIAGFLVECEPVVEMTAGEFE